MYKLCKIYTVIFFIDEEDVFEDEGFGQSPGGSCGQPQPCPPQQPRRPSLSRSCSAPLGISIELGKSPRLFYEKLPRVTISDFSALNLDVDTSKHTG